MKTYTVEVQVNDNSCETCYVFVKPNNIDDKGNVIFNIKDFSPPSAKIICAPSLIDSNRNIFESKVFRRLPICFYGDHYL